MCAGGADHGIAPGAASDHEKWLDVAPVAVRDCSTHSRIMHSQCANASGDTHHIYTESQDPTTKCYCNVDNLSIFGLCDLCSEVSLECNLFTKYNDISNCNYPANVCVNVSGHMPLEYVTTDVATRYDGCGNDDEICSKNIDRQDVYSNTIIDNVSGHMPIRCVSTDVLTRYNGGENDYACSKNIDYQVVCSIENKRVFPEKKHVESASQQINHSNNETLKISNVKPGPCCGVRGNREDVSGDVIA